MQSVFPNIQKKSIIPAIFADKIIITLIFILFFDFVLFPAPILAKNEDFGTQVITNEAVFAENITKKEVAITNKEVAITKKTNIKTSGLYEMTAYTSEVAQCDASPCITANGFNVCAHGIEDTVAANFLKFGTKIKIPELYGDRIFVVRDRMNKRYPDRVDIWFKDKKQAIKFGFKVAKIEVLE